MMRQVAEELGVRYVRGRQRAPGRRPRAHHRPAQRRRHRQSPLGRTLRSRIRRRVRRAGRDHREHRRRDRAQALCRREFSRPAQAARQPGCLGSGDAGAVALLAGDAAGQRGGAGAAGKGDRARSQLRPGARPARHRATCSPRIWAGWRWPPRCRLAEPVAQAAMRADGEDPWAHNALGHVNLFARRFEDSLAAFETALRLNPNFALAQGYYGLVAELLRDAGRTPTRPPAAPSA